LYVGRTLYKKNIGIIGMGRIGKLVARYASSFYMNVFYYDKNKKKVNFFFRKLTTLRKLLNLSDVVVVALDLNKKTNKIFNYNYFKQMKKDSILINASRGEIICENSLLKALKKKIIFGAALDVIANENNINFKKNKIINYALNNKNLIITPHTGGATVETWRITEEFIVKKFAKYLMNHNLN
jgi:lactate dehydrogenase-like 2-hydroxyacid dehydrogenase